MKIMLICTFILFALACNFVVTSAYPERYPESIDRFDRDVTDFDNSNSNYNYRNSRIRRTYYYDDGDYYGYYPYASYNTPIRRQDTNVDDSDIDRAYKYTPLVRYKSTRTKRKKLFVPNLWG